MENNADADNIYLSVSFIYLLDHCDTIIVKQLLRGKGRDVIQTPCACCVACAHANMACMVSQKRIGAIFFEKQTNEFVDICDVCLCGVKNVAS